MKNQINYIQSVKEFMSTAGQPTPDTIIDIPEDRNKLRIALLFEELSEYAEASGLLEYFNDLCSNSNEKFDKDITNYVPVIDQVEQLDALLDMQYILSGTVIEHGFDTIFDEGFKLVHESNMSKFDDNVEDAKDTKIKYLKEGVNTVCDQVGFLYVTKRMEDDKVLKSHKYQPVNLKPLLNK